MTAIHATFALPPTGWAQDIRVAVADGAVAGADTLLDHWIFTQHVDVDCVWANGNRVVENGRHHLRETIGSRFKHVMSKLLDA